MNEEQSQEIWEVEAGGQVFQTNFAEMTEWIADGSLLRIDRVRKGNLRWIEAGKVPALVAVFNAKDDGAPTQPPVVTLTKLGPSTFDASASTTNITKSISSPPTATSRNTPSEPTCSMHEDLPAAFTCKTCSNNFCKTCPNSYGGSVKICPFCGAMCEAIAKKDAQPREVYYAPVGKFGFGDFGDALKYPFKFMPSLVMGAVMFMFLSVGQGVASIGGIFMMWGAIACALCANTLTFGILANTVENFSQGKIGENFMPSFDDFSLWEDVVHPFFLMIGAYLASFGPLIAVIVLAFFFIVAPVRNEINAAQKEAATAISPQIAFAANAAKQSEKVRQIMGNEANRQRNFAESVDSGDTSEESYTFRDTAEDEEARFAELQNMIQEHRKAQLESVAGKTPETEANEKIQFIREIIGRGIVFVLFAGICLLWGLFYYPAACAVAGYTRSFTATINPTVGLDTIRRLGVDYFKILAMCLLLIIASGFVSSVLSTVFAPFDMPQVGNIPATAIGSIFSFYLSIVFACVIGFALYRSAEKLKLYQ